LNIHATILIIAMVTAIDNALLAGIMVSHENYPRPYWLLASLGILLVVAQIVSVGAIHLIAHHLMFQVASIFILALMSIRTLTDPPLRSRPRGFRVIPLWLITYFGNIDNILWFGSAVHRQYRLLTVYSIFTFPVFYLTALFLSKKLAEQRWIRPLGAGMMAWAAASMTTEIPWIRHWIISLGDASIPTFQCLIAATLLFIGFVLRKAGRTST